MFYINKNLSQKWSAKSNYNKVLEKSAVCTKKITEDKYDCIKRMTNKLQDSSIVPKMYWAILGRLLYNKEISALQPLLADGKFVSKFCEKTNLFNIFFFQEYVHQYKMQAFYQLLDIEQMPE